MDIGKVLEGQKLPDVYTVAIVKKLLVTDDVQALRKRADDPHAQVDIDVYAGIEAAQGRTDLERALALKNYWDLRRSV
jgi:hypothetical protein